jgi:hypothetical protein
MDGSTSVPVAPRTGFPLWWAVTGVRTTDPEL